MLLGILSAVLLLGPWIAGPGPGLGPVPGTGVGAGQGLGQGSGQKAGPGSGPGRADDSWAHGSLSPVVQGAGDGTDTGRTTSTDGSTTRAEGLPQGQGEQQLGLRGRTGEDDTYSTYSTNNEYRAYSVWENSFWSPSTWWDQIVEFEEGLGKTLAALSLVGIAMVLASLNHLGLSTDMAVSVARAFLQLSVIGFVLSFIFLQEGWRGLLMISAAYCFMVLVAGYTAGQRAKGIPHASAISCTAIFLGSGATIGLLVALRVFDFTPRYLIPVAGMMVGNAMTNTAVALKRLREDLRQTVPLIEAALALGATPRQAIQQQIKRSLALALTPVLDNAKTLGIISLPGAMTGMIMGGASPLEATKLQMVVATFLIGCSTLSCMLAVFMAWPCFFTPAYQVVGEYLEAS